MPDLKTLPMDTVHFVLGPWADRRPDVPQLESHSDDNDHSEHGTPLDELIPLGCVTHSDMRRPIVSIKVL